MIDRPQIIIAHKSRIKSATFDVAIVQVQHALEQIRLNRHRRPLDSHH